MRVANFNQARHVEPVESGGSILSLAKGPSTPFPPTPETIRTTSRVSRGLRLKVEAVPSRWALEL